MRKVNVADVEEFTWSSPKGTFEGAGKLISEALGRDRFSTDVMERHPFDVELMRVPPGKKPFPYHSHSAQWEMYIVVSGSAIARDDDGEHRIAAGDAFIYKPGEAHQFLNDTDADFLVYIIADNPLGESVHYPDSKKWGVRSPARALLTTEVDDYYHGEE